MIGSPVFLGINPQALFPHGFAVEKPILVSHAAGLQIRREQGSAKNRKLFSKRSLKIVMNPTTIRTLLPNVLG